MLKVNMSLFVFSLLVFLPSFCSYAKFLVHWKRTLLAKFRHVSSLLQEGRFLPEGMQERGELSVLLLLLKQTAGLASFLDSIKSTL